MMIVDSFLFGKVMGQSIWWARMIPKRQMFLERDPGPQSQTPPCVPSSVRTGAGRQHGGSCCATLRGLYIMPTSAGFCSWQIINCSRDIFKQLLKRTVLRDPGKAA